ncbi:peptide MFS transporter [Sphingomonas sp. RT2P30]|uniref:peptide MFS transporter n=1 Tax=Parasphingomonas halimpatiens TaxID=3096162 RepID=UPI002FC921A3
MDAAPVPVPASWFGQPPGLTILFLTEMWEKFSYYGMRTLLIYYMVKQLMLSQAHASLVYGLYTAFVYFTPILGGVISDRWLGRRRAVIIGGSIMAAGHFLMASEPLFYVALATIALGNGLYLTNLPSQIGSLYAGDDPRRNSAYSVYYVGVNLGALLAPVLCGTIGEIYGWHWGFALAGIGMLTGLLIYVFGARHLPPEPPRAAAVDRGEVRPWRWNALWLLLGVAIAVAILRGAYEQIGNTIALWADGQVDRRLVAGVTIPMTWFQALNPLLIFIITPFLIKRWTRQAREGREPSSTSKMAIGAAGIGVAYLLLAVTSFATTAPGAQTSWVWLSLFLTVLTAAELWVLPIGVGLFARLAPPHMSATIIAAWFLATFAGNLLAGLLGTLWSSMPPAAFFAVMGGVAGTSALGLLLLKGPATRAEAARSGA